MRVLPNFQASMKEITTEQECLDYINSHSLAVLKFGSPSCGPCRAIEPHVSRLEREFPTVAWASVDMATAYPVAAKFEISSAPTFVFFNENKEVARIVGANVPQLNTEVQNLASSSGSSTAGSSDNWPVANHLNNTIEKTGLEVLNVGTTGADLFTTGATTTVTDADSQLLAFVPFQNRVTLNSILIQLPTSYSDAQPPSHIKVFASLPSALSFEDAQSHRALVDEDLGQPTNGWIEVKLRLVHFQSVSSILVFITGEDDDEPTAIQRIVLAGKQKEHAQGSIHED